MFTFFCPNCEAKLIVKDEKLIGKIVPCPQCGGMVLIQLADDVPTPLHNITPEPVVHKRFPDVLSHETDSGIIGHTSKENIRTEAFLQTISQDTDVSETEVKTRKVLVGILIGLSIFLLVVFGFLIVFQSENTPPLPPPQEGNNLPKKEENHFPPLKGQGEASEEEHFAQQHDGVVSFEENVLTEAPPIAPIPIHGEQPPTPNDVLSAIEERMPGFVDISVPNIDIDTKLAMPIGELNFDKSSLIEFVRVISRLTEIPMTLDIDEMKARSLSVNTSVSGRFSEATAEEILTQTLATLGLQWVAVDRQILIFPKETADKVDLTFDVSDFAERTDDLTTTVLAEMVQRLVVPETNVVVSPNNRLTIIQEENRVRGKSPMRQRGEILQFLEQLRAVRQLPQKAALTEETLAPEAFGWDRVMVPMTLNHYRPVLFSRIIAQLESMTDLTILVDHQSLHRALCPFASVMATVQCDRGTVNDVLELSLASVDLAALAYRIVDHHTLEITTMESARQPEKMVMEVHRYELRADETPEDIARSLRLRSRVAPDSWVVPELPETRYGGDIVIDPPSNCLFVRQSQPAQRQIRLLLSTSELFESEEMFEP